MAVKDNSILPRPSWQLAAYVRRFSGQSPKKRKKRDPSEQDLESLWQNLLLRFEDRGVSLPRRWRHFRLVVANLLAAGARGWF
jgi:hypothetical protein